jgi:hypothetical protein
MTSQKTKTWRGGFFSSLSAVPSQHAIYPKHLRVIESKEVLSPMLVSGRLFVAMLQCRICPGLLALNEC